MTSQFKPLHQTATIQGIQDQTVIAEFQKAVTYAALSRTEHTAQLSMDAHSNAWLFWNEISSVFEQYPSASNFDRNLTAITEIFAALTGDLMVITEPANIFGTCDGVGNHDQLEWILESIVAIKEKHAIKMAKIQKGYEMLKTMEAALNAEWTNLNQNAGLVKMVEIAAQEVVAAAAPELTQHAVKEAKQRESWGAQDTFRFSAEMMDKAIESRRQPLGKDIRDSREILAQIEALFVKTEAEKQETQATIVERKNKRNADMAAAYEAELVEKARKEKERLAKAEARKQAKLEAAANK